MIKRIAQLNNLTIGNNLERTLFVGACGSLGLLFFIYTYLIGSITFGVVERQHIEDTIRDLRSRVSVLEVQYVNETKGLTLDRARTLGLQEVATQTFAARQNGLSLR